MKLGFLPVLILLLVTPSLFADQTPSASGTGVEGVILVSPIRPGPLKRDSEIPTSGPCGNIAFVLEGQNGAATSFITNEEGRFRVPLAPGHYIVSRKEKTGGPGYYGPFEVDVAAGKMTQVEWHCDSGMR